VAAVGAASIVLAPYLYGSGLKIKVVEAAGTGRPIITTAAGVEGTGMRDGEHLLVADGAEAFADAIVRLLDDPELGQRLGDAGRRHVSHAFSVDACYGALIEIIQSRSAESSKPGLIPSSVEARIGELLAVLQPPPGLVVWGNGSHTRALLHVLGRLNAPVRCVVDKSAAAESLSPEGVRVVSPSHFRPEREDVILLSSQTFEPQMWKDVSLVRGEAQAMALYRRELITPELKQRLPGAKPRRPRVAAAVASATSRLVLLEPSAGKRGGHFYRPAQALQLAAAQRSMSVVLAGSRRVSLEGLSQEEQGLIEPTFESSFWDALPATSDDTWPQIARSSKLFAHDLARLAARLNLREDDVVMVAMANILEVLGVAQWLGSSAARSFPEIRLLFHFLPHHEAAWLKTSEPEIRHAYRLALAMLDDQTGERLRILAQSSALATGLEEVFGRPVDPVGYPLSSSTPVARNGRSRSPYRLLFAGEARSDKGFALLPGLADALAAELGDGRVQLVCQAKLNAFADDTLKAAVGTLAMRPGITIIEEYLPAESYEALIAGSDLVVLPYDPEHYRARLSAVFVDATCAGVAVAVPAGTWMASQLELGLGAGERFRSVGANDIADAVRRAMAARGDIEQAAQQAAARARAQHDPAAVLDGILARARVAA
jgi:glycosyltransferase involved in cell wall biosynthesis